MTFIDLKNEFDLLMRKHPHAESALLPLLHKVKNDDGLLDEQKIADLAELCKVSSETVGKFAEELVTTRQCLPGSQICMDLPCYINGANEIYERGSGVINGTEQNIEKFHPSRCLGHCYAAPVVALSDGALCQIKIPS